MLIKDKIKNIIDNRSIDFCEMTFQLKDSDYIEIFFEEDDVWKEEPIFRKTIKEIDPDESDFNRTFFRYMLYKPEANVAEDVHIAFIINKKERPEGPISLKVSYS